MRKSALFALAPAAAAVVIAGCGGSGSSAGSAASGGSAGSGGRDGHSKAAPSKTASAAPTVTLAPSQFGEILVDSHGRTLYDPAGDTKPGQTTGQAINQFGAPWYVLTADGTEIHNG